VDAPQISLGELALGAAIRGADDCEPYSYVKAAFGSGTQVEILYERYEYTSDYSGSRQVGGLLIVDGRDPTKPTITGKLEWNMGGSSESSSTYYWYTGFYDYGGYNPARSPVARAGDALVIMEASETYSGSEGQRKARLRVIDLRNAEAPSAELLELTGRSYSGFVASGDDVLLSFYEEGERAGRVRFFVQPVSLADLGAPRLGDAVNVPGALMHYDADRGRIVTSELTRIDGDDTTAQACDDRFGYYRFEYPQNGISIGGEQMPIGTCEGYRQTLHLVKLEADAATLEDSLDIEEARVVTSSSLGDDRMFAVLGNGYGYYGRGPAIDCFGPCGGYAIKSDPVELLVLSGLESGALTHGRVSVDAVDDPWWGFWGALPVHAHGTSALLTSYDDLTIIDASDAAEPKLVRTEALFGGISDVAFSGNNAFLALGQAGAQRIPLP
jgi:hypothetical protein